MFVIFLALFASMDMLIMTHFPVRTVKVNEPMRVITENVKAGDFALYEVDYCRYTDAASSVVTQLNGVTISRISEDAPILSKGCGKAIRQVKIPLETKPGEYVIEEHVRFFVNPFRVIDKVFRTEKFIVE